MAEASAPAASASAASASAASASAPQLEDFLDQIGAAKREAEAVAKELTAAQGSWRPGSARWSVAECIKHLNLIAEAYLPVLDDVIDRALAKGRRTARARPIGWVGRQLIRMMEPPPKRSFQAVAMVVPPADLSVRDVLAEFLAMQDELATRVRRCHGVDLARVKVVSPLNRLLRFRLDVCVAFLLAHQRRHLYQAQQVLASPEFPRDAEGPAAEHVS